MTSPVEIEYKLTKLIKQGKAIIDSDFVELCEWIDKSYNVKTLNIIYDVIDSNPRPRLQIIFEWEREQKIFRTDYGYNETLQKEIARQFEIIISKRKQGLKTKWYNLFDKPKYSATNILIVFGAFETAAKIEANWKVAENEIKQLQEKLKLNNLWLIYPEMFDSPTFFFFTDKQVEENSKSEMTSFLTSEYFNLLKTFDEFNYIKKDEFVIKFDSKENFEKSYSSSWYYYDRR